MAEQKDQPARTEATEEVPTDFLTYLERRLSTGPEETLAMLGEWLMSYEPVQPRNASARRIQARHNHDDVASAA